MSAVLKQLHLIVEGGGDALAVPKLVHHVLRDHALHHVTLTKQVDQSGAIPKRRDQLSNFVSKYLGYALKRGCPVLWVLDCDDKRDGILGCPLEHVTALRLAMQDMHIPQPVEFAFFVKEFESLFLAEKQAIKAHFGLSADTLIEDGAATRRNAKGEISNLLPKGRAYKETIDQVKITSALDLSICRQVSRDFRHFESALLRLCQHTPPSTPIPTSVNPP